MPRFCRGFCLFVDFLSLFNLIVFILWNIEQIYLLLENPYFFVLYEPVAAPSKVSTWHW